MTEKLKNWAGNVEFKAARFFSPQTIAQAQELVQQSRQMKVLGSRHSFNTIADTAADLISLENLNQVISLDREGQTVTVEGGIRYGELSQYLHQQGFALHNMASLPHISVAGACATATHGSGDGNGNLATAVTAIELIRADGEIVTLSREQNGEQFAGAVVHLGGLGVVTKLTLEIAPTFNVQQNIYEGLSLSQVAAHFEEILGAAYSVSLFTDWRTDSFNQVWLKQRLIDDVPLQMAPDFFGALPASARRHPLAEHSAESCTEQMGIPGPWCDRLAHFQMDFTPSSGAELQTEYFVARQDAVAAMQALHQIRKQIAPLLFISEIRTIAADNLWLSPCYQQDSVTFHFTWETNWPAVQQLLPLIEAQLEPFKARPHWGKLFTMPPALVQEQYEKMPAFQQLLQMYDPQGKFRNSFLDTNIFGIS